MPLIEISADQAAALGRGENITIAPEPPKRVLRNVMLYYKPGKSSWFVWDGEIVGNDIFAYRFQRLTNAFGEPAAGPVVTRPRDYYRGGNRFGAADKNVIVQVGE